MKKLVLLFAFSMALAFGQHFHGPRVIVRPAPVRVWVGPGYGYYDPFYGYFWGGPVLVQTPDPCKKQKLKDADGKKHEVLVCRQPDGSVKVFSPDGTEKK